MLVFAHRGSSGVAPENTLSAFSLALADKVDGIELDVQVIEGVAMVIHNNWLQGTTTGMGRLDQVSLDYCLTLDAGDGQKIPSLEQVLKLVAGQCLVNIEIKAHNAEEVVVAVAKKAVNEFGFKAEQLIISSFNLPALKRVGELAPEFPLGALTANIPLDYAAFAEQVQAKTIHLNRDFITPEFVDDSHKRGLKVYVYTVNYVEDIQLMLEMGVDGIFTDYPNRALDYLSSVEK
ncbi:glycerophosphodiester phosphodiesterase [Catenovulum maritimum]|uniref:GP-PDE domain-containing protein n=1 Tax=Catenovulum maritimum TaxID=1513271 RepID=A0A0J8GMQ8_9ALTE|nr:glycerophosphodiester phosphodiesterase family protein [Catenovulum maritimum]KMT64067.1 hypothetical protein XM47_16280 [Catenovulum maritimum]